MENELQEKIKNQAEHIKQLEELTREQKRQLTIANDCLREKNRVLDAMHYVWCDGGCPGGVHRFAPMRDIPLTEEIVRTAEYTTIRLRTWFSNKTYRDGNYKKATFRWRIVLWLAGLTWNSWRKRRS